jgi:hypothetical protein
MTLLLVDKLQLVSVGMIKNLAKNVFHDFALVNWDLYFKCSAGFLNCERRFLGMRKTSSNRCKCSNSELRKFGHSDF